MVINLKKFLRDLFFFFLWMITVFLVIKSVESPSDSQKNVPVDVQYETRSDR